MGLAMAIYRFLSYLNNDPDYPDLWDGSFVADEVHALEGDDIVHAGGGDDLVWGGFGNDHVYGGAGNDELNGDSDWGEQFIQEGLDSGEDTLFGEEGNDTLNGGYGEDRLFGGSVESADDVVHGLGADTLRGGNDDDLLYAIEGGVRSVAIDSVADASAVDLGDTLDGGAGNDTFFIEHDFTGTMQIAGGTEIDTLTFDRDEYDSFILRGPNVVNFVDLQSQVGTTPLGSHIVIQTVENIIGDGYDDIFRGDDGINELDGMGGNDRLEGRGGGDTLDGGDGTDVADYSSSLGAVDVDLTRATQIGGHAQDDVLLKIEDVDGSRYYGDTLRGDSHANYLFGNGGNDTLEGRGGADTLDGGLNTDTASYEHSGAAVNVRLAEPLTGAASQASGGDAAGDVLISIENLTGSRFNDTLTGNSVGNVIDGGDGSDIMAGAAGNDVYFVDTADHYVIVNPFTHQMAFVAGDQVIEQANAGIDQVNASVSFTLSANVENLNLLTGAVNGTGNDLDNRFFFSSRSRHTRCLSDWSSDVCSSDLTYAGRTWRGHKIEGLLMNTRMVQGIFDDRNPQTVANWQYSDSHTWDPARNTREFVAAKIGRASCRERV